MSHNPHIDASVSACPSRPSCFRFMYGSGKKPLETSQNIEISNVETPHCTLPTPPSAVYISYHCQANGSPTALDDFFGAGALEAHRPLARATTVSAPPPYAPYGCDVVETQSATYSLQEPPTLARMLFIYGFLFFPFWLAGIYILAFPLSPTTDWEIGKSDVEKVELLRLLRKTEKKWARRCVYALCSLITFILLLVVIIKFGIMASV